MKAGEITDDERVLDINAVHEAAEVVWQEINRTAKQYGSTSPECNAADALWVRLVNLRDRLAQEYNADPAKKYSVSPWAWWKG